MKLIRLCVHCPDAFRVSFITFIPASMWLNKSWHTLITITLRMRSWFCHQDQLHNAILKVLRLLWTLPKHNERFRYPRCRWCSWWDCCHVCYIVSFALNDFSLAFWLIVTVPWSSCPHELLSRRGTNAKWASGVCHVTSITPGGLQSVYQAVVDIIKREGVLGLYSGLNSSLLGIAVTNGYASWIMIRNLSSDIIKGVLLLLWAVPRYHS